MSLYQEYICLLNIIYTEEKAGVKVAPGNRIFLAEWTNDDICCHHTYVTTWHHEILSYLNYNFLWWRWSRWHFAWHLHLWRNIDLFMKMWWNYIFWELFNSFLSVCLSIRFLRVFFLVHINFASKIRTAPLLNKLVTQLAQ